MSDCKYYELTRSDLLNFDLHDFHPIKMPRRTVTEHVAKFSARPAQRQTAIYININQELFVGSSVPLERTRIFESASRVRRKLQYSLTVQIRKSSADMFGNYTQNICCCLPKPN